MRKINTKKAMSTFETIGYAILAIVVVLVAIVIFVKLTKGPTNSIETINGGSQKSIDECIKDPTKCGPSTTKEISNINEIDVTKYWLTDYA